MSDKTSELKRCPFCGGEARLNYERIPGEDKGFWAQIICQECHARSGGIWAGSYNSAERKETKAWNTRKPMDRIVERLEDNKMWSELMIYSLTHREREIIKRAIEIVKKEGGV